MGLPSLWVAHLPPQDTEGLKSFEATIRGSTTALGRLQTLLQERNQTLMDVEASEKNYSDASWSHKQAHRNGRRQELKFITDLLSFLDQ